MGRDVVENLEQSIRLVVQEVIKNLDLQAFPAGAPGAATSQGHGIFADIDSAIAAAKIAHQELMQLPLETRKAMIQNMRQTILENNERLSKKAMEETGLGRWQSKMIKHRLVALKSPGVEDLEPVSYTDDHGLTLVERAPYGVIGSITPTTNPSSTVVNNSIGMIAAGNAVVFNPHPGAKEVSCLTISLLNDAIVKAGGPRNLLSATPKPTIESAQA
ncbi:aldehyde dehydrogenase family protein, partial [candidate division KSB3 bacterium]|nr:aldehyde dehydrogenase family protein [candidate division KSB3 bacterium]MBD3325478.1 aldehyde dehydrogenase family protein [candidate division KSB3 bacterium]